jgi:anti-sigma B factor antagonist
MEPAYLVVNLAGVEFLDSNTLAILVHGLKRAHQNRGDLRLCCLRNSVRILFELTRLDNVFEIFVSEEDAIQSYKVVEKLSQPA